MRSWKHNEVIGLALANNADPLRRRATSGRTSHIERLGIVAQRVSGQRYADSFSKFAAAPLTVIVPFRRHTKSDTSRYQRIVSAR